MSKPPSKPAQQSLSTAEWEVMKILWDNGPQAARDVYAALPGDVDWAYRTVKTLLSRLVAKGALDYEQIGNSYLYRPIVAREQMTRQEVRGLFQRVVGAAFSPVFANFIEEADLSDEEIRELKRMLDQKRNDTRSSKK